MGRVEKKFTELKAKGRKAFIPFITAGDPTLAATERFVGELEKAGADFIELGVPFSDPLADGTTIQAAHERALKKNVQPQNVLALVRSLSRKVTTPLLLMSSFNLIYAPGISRFVRDAALAGVAGLIVPDLPPEEAQEFVGEAKKQNVDVIFLMAPTSTPERLQTIARSSSGFIYMISLTGITGARTKLSEEIPPFIARVRAITNKPLAIGFGISTPEQARQMSRLADGVIVGSAIVDRIAHQKPIYPFAKKLSDAIHSG